MEYNLLLVLVLLVFVSSLRNKKCHQRASFVLRTISKGDQGINRDKGDRQDIDRDKKQINRDKGADINRDKTRDDGSITTKTWRLYEVYVLLSDDPGKDDVSVHDNLYSNVLKELNLKSNSIKKVTSSKLPIESIQIIRKSFDPRIKKSGQPRFVYTVDVTIPTDLSSKLQLKSVEGKIELITNEIVHGSSNVISTVNKTPRVIIVGAGPAGLFAALNLIECGLKPIIIERGKPVEERGRDIGALFNRKILNPNSNLCYGEGGAGTWSDGKLTTRIGKNSVEVRKVLTTLVRHGAPEKILIDGKPHLGTDRLVRILRDMRQYLTSKGAEFLFDTTVDDIIISDDSMNSIKGVTLSDSRKLDADICVLAVGHSARKLYTKLENKGIIIECKPIAVGFRVEHPQDVINKIQYGTFGSLCERGKGKVPVADYRLATEVDSESTGSRGVYSFCMCPGGQIVPTSVNPDELCVNGMSFSKRESRWANSALVVTVNPSDIEGTDILRGVQWQQEIERKAARYGGGNLVCPVQRVTDFLSESIKDMDLPTLSSSYRMGVKYAPNHEIYPAFVTKSLQNALQKFDRLMPGFITHDAILHGVETRTSAPVQIKRDPNTLECLTVKGLYPSGEGAGYAGGIVSAAVDGMKVSDAIVRALS